MKWFKNLFKSDLDNWDELEKIEADKEKTKNKRFKKKRKKTDDFLTRKALHTFLIKTIPDGRMLPRNCVNFSIKIFSVWVELICYTRIGQQRIFRYMLEEPFLDGVITIKLKEKEFHNVILRQRMGIFQVINNHKILVNQKYEYPILKYEINREVIV